MREIDISADLLPQHHVVLRAMGLIAKTQGTDVWCLVGGMMVLAVAREAGRSDSRGERTKDGDIVVDVVSETDALGRVARQLLALGYELPPDDHGIDFARCTFVSGRAQVDVLAPDDATADQLDVEDSIRTLAMPGGRRALRGATMTTVTYAHDAFDVELRVPTLLTAIVVKAAAATDPRTAGQPRHAEDVAFLLACIDDPVELRDELVEGDTDVLRHLHDTRLADPVDAAWRNLSDSDRRRGSAALELLLA